MIELHNLQISIITFFVYRVLKIMINKGVILIFIKKLAFLKTRFTFPEIKVHFQLILDCRS